MSGFHARLLLLSAGTLAVFGVACSSAVRPSRSMAEEGVGNRDASEAYAQWRQAQPAGRPAWFVAETGATEENGWLPGEEWRKTSAIPFQFLDGSGDRPQAPTRARLLTRDGRLFLRFECREPDMAHLVYTHTGRDSAALWRDDLVEIFVEPGEGGTRYHLMFNPAGGSFDAAKEPGKGEDCAWDPPLRSRTFLEKDGWTLELSLPLASFADAGATVSNAPPVWHVNLARVRQGREGAFAEDTGWCRTGTLGAGDPAYFGSLYFAVRPAVVSARVPRDPPSGGAPCAPAQLVDVLRGRFQRPAVVVNAGADATGKLCLIPLSDSIATAVQPTTAEVRRTPDGLRVHVRCAEPDPRGLAARANSDGANIWDDDSVEVFLTPERKESSDYLHVVVNAAGSVYTGRGTQHASFDGVRAQAAVGADAWTADLQVPFSALGLSPGRIPALWGLNVTRNRPARTGAASQCTAWSRFPWSAHDPATFGTLWLAEADRIPDLGADAANLEAEAQLGRELAARDAERDRGAGMAMLADTDVFGAAERDKRALPTMLPRHLAALRDRLLAERDRVWNAVQTAEDARQLQARIRDAFLHALGGLPAEKCPLHPRVTVAFENDELRIERLIYESRPGFYVTANLFVPKARGSRRLPVVLRVVGHSTRGRFGALDFCEDLARAGYLAMTIDLSGQGERIYVDNGLGSRSPTSNHYAEGAGCVLTGGNLAGYMIYDVMRAIDYLETRDEADPHRVVLTGESGGGTMTEYVAALDPRIFAAAPVSSGGSARGGTGNYDSEQVLAGAFPGALDIEGFSVLAAPRPYCVIAEAGAAARQATEQSFARARRIAALLGGTPEAAARLQYVPTSAPHGYGKTHAELFRKWLDRTLPPDPDGPRIARKSGYDRDACRATRSGREYYSRDLPVRETTLTLNAQRIAPSCAFDSSVRTREAAAAQSARLRMALRRLLALEDDNPAPLSVESRGVVTNGEVMAEKLVLETEPGVLVPALLLANQGAPRTGAAVVWVSSRGKGAVLSARGDALRAVLATGARILVPDLRGLGETAGDADATFEGDDTSFNGMGIELGRPLIGMRVRDVLSCVAYLRMRADVDAGRISLLGDSPSHPNPPHIRQALLITDPGLETLTQAESLGPVVVLLAFALDAGVARCATCGLPDSYAGMCRTPYVYHPFGVFVPGILQTCDIADLCAVAAPRPLLLAGCVNAANQRLDQAHACDETMVRARHTYGLQGAMSQLVIEPAGDIGRAAAFCAPLPSVRFVLKQ